MEARLQEAELLKRIVNVVKQLCTQVNFEFSPNGIILQEMDSAHISFASLYLSGEKIKDYKCDKTYVLGINLDSLHKILHCANGTDELTLRYKDGQEYLTVLFESGVRISMFRIKLMHIDCERLNLPDTEYQACIKLSGTSWKRYIEEFVKLDQTLGISVEKNGFKLHTGQESMEAGTSFFQHNPDEKDDATHVTVRCEFPVKRQWFPIRFLKMFAAEDKLCRLVRLRLSPNVPIIVEYLFPEHLGYLKFYLAPKMVDEEVAEEMAPAEELDHTGPDEP